MMPIYRPGRKRVSNKSICCAVSTIQMRSSLFEAEDVQKAQEFGNSSDLREAIQKAGVVDKPGIHF